MRRGTARRESALALAYPASAPCACEICRRYCLRPGWWTVAEAASALAAGHGGRMMLEIAPERTFAVLAPAFRGCEGSFALQRFADRGCNFLADGRCELYGTGFEPLECRFCHHDRAGLGPQCHAALEHDWRTAEGRALVSKWARMFHARGELLRLGLGRIAG